MKLKVFSRMKPLFGVIVLFSTLTISAQTYPKLNLQADHQLLIKKIIENRHVLDQLKEYESAMHQQILFQREKSSPDKGITTDTLVNGVRVIPVVFHIIHQNGIENIRDEQVLNAIQLLNIDFSATNIDTVLGENTASQFANRRANPAIEFRLARLDPDGNPTSAILRHQDTSANGVSYPVMATYAWDPQKYLNIFSVGGISVEGVGEGTIVGMSLFPPTNPLTSLFTDDPMCDGVLIRHDAIGNIGTAENLAGMEVNAQNRSLTHELGHYFNLYHPFQNFTEDNIYSAMYQGLGLIDGCAESVAFMGPTETLYGDYVDDTPPVIAASQVDGNYCIQVGSRNTCPNQVNGYGDEPDMVENYMDYQWGFCTNLFTIGQLERINATLNGHRRNLWSYENLVATGILEYNEIGSQSEIPFVNIYPNPAVEACTITYQLPNNAQVTISVFDMLGREIMKPINQFLRNGIHQLVINKSDIGNSGIYFINIKVDNNSKTCKVIFR